MLSRNCSLVPKGISQCSLGSEIIAMMLSAQSRHRHDASARAAGDFGLASSGCLFCQSKMSAVLVVIGYSQCKHS